MASGGVTPIAISGASNEASVLPEGLSQIVGLRSKAASQVNRSLALELKSGQAGVQVDAMLSTLRELLSECSGWRQKKSGRRIKEDDEARALYCEAWARARIGEYDGTSAEELPNKLREALSLFDRAGKLIGLAEPPRLDEVPSVTRPTTRTSAPVALKEQEAWVGEFLAEWARTEATLAFAQVIARSRAPEESIAFALEQACRRNVQALFTPLSEATSSTEASIVLGTARLISEIANIYPFSQSTPWAARLNWATHVSDVRFVEASLSADGLINEAQASASMLSSPTGQSRARRREVRDTLQETVRRLVPVEMRQGVILVQLAQQMLDAIYDMYMGMPVDQSRERGRTESSKEAYEESDDGEGRATPLARVPENALVRETRQVLIRAASLFESAYASFLRSQLTARTEQKLLRRLENAYILLEKLDNDEPEVQELRAQRIDRAITINDRLTVLDGTLAQTDHDEEEEVDEDLDDEGAEEDLVLGLERQRLNL